MNNLLESVHISEEIQEETQLTQSYGMEYVPLMSQPLPLFLQWNLQYRTLQIQDTL